MDDEERRNLAQALKSADEPMIREIIREAESFLNAQLQAGLAADMRAMTLAAVLAAIIAAIVGGVASLVAAKVDVGIHIISAVLLCVCLLIALFSAVQAARPSDFDYAGNNPTRWKGDVVSRRPLVESLAGQAALYAQGIENNSGVLSAGHLCLRRALKFVLIGVLGAAGVELIVLLSLAAQGKINLSF